MKVAVDVDVTPRMLATAFCEMGDEDQAQFFIEAAEIARGWTNTNCPQWYMVGRHLATCSCSTDDARALVTDIAQGALGGQAT